MTYISAGWVDEVKIQTIWVVQGLNRKHLSSLQLLKLVWRCPFSWLPGEFLDACEEQTFMKPQLQTMFCSSSWTFAAIINTSSTFYFNSLHNWLDRRCIVYRLSSYDGKVWTYWRTLSLEPPFFICLDCHIFTFLVNPSQLLGVEWNFTAPRDLEIYSMPIMQSLKNREVIIQACIKNPLFHLFNNWWITWMQNVVRISDDYIWTQSFTLQ